MSLNSGFFISSFRAVFFFLTRAEIMAFIHSIILQIKQNTQIYILWLKAVISAGVAKKEPLFWDM